MNDSRPREERPQIASSFPVETGAPGATRGLMDALAFSNGLPALIAIALSLVASEFLYSPRPIRSALLAGTGTFVVYALDRLRDTQRDLATSPLRTQFTLRNERPLALAVGVAGLILFGALLFSPIRVALLCAGVGVVGIFHRRLKGIAALEALYVSLAWVAACVGIPWVGDPNRVFDARLLWIAGILFTTIGANLIASSERDRRATDLRHLREKMPMHSLALARTGALLAFAAGLLGPSEILPLAWIPAAEALALAFYRPTEHYGQLVVDGALLAGAGFALLHSGGFHPF